MDLDVGKEHAVETFKSLIQISVEGLKLLALLNGGAAVALLAYLGNISGKAFPTPDMRLPMSCFLVGLLLCGFAFAGSYLTQLWLYNESMGRGARRRHTRWLWLTMSLGLLSLGAFGLGCLFSVSRFR